jgi:murein DD-endopeptidase MepM/ murein hydrolase activator NlpD
MFLRGIRIRAARRAAGVVLVVAVAMLPPSTWSRDPSVPAPPAPEDGATSSRWTWPLEPFSLERPFEAPAHRYASGHRGVDVRAMGVLTVRAPAGGVVAFAGRVVDRDVLTIDHGGGLVTTLEPVTSALSPGEPVAAGDTVGELSVGGHTEPGALHIGVRMDGEYINPMTLFGEVPRAVLLPCC